MTDPNGLRAQATVSVLIDCPQLDCPPSVTLQVPEDLPVGNILGQVPQVWQNVLKNLLWNRSAVTWSFVTLGWEPQSRWNHRLPADFTQLAHYGRHKSSKVS